MSALTSDMQRPGHRARAAALSGFFGSTLEYYDYFIYGSASALVLGKLFFPNAGASATLLAFSTVAVSYIARPFGAILLGHFGDRLGRKNVLLVTLLIMGTATLLIGCLPTYSTLGVWATVLLVALRCIQGLSAGGESPGSSSLSLEHAPDHRRGFYTSWTLTGVTFGIVLSSLVFIPVANLPDSALLSWGWRVPFWLSVVVTAMAYFIRRKLDEPEVFVDAKERGDTVKVPIFEVFRRNWSTVLRVAICAVVTMVNSVFTVFALAYATEEQGISRSGMLTMIAVSNLVSAVLTPVYGALSDRIGRRPLFFTGCIGSAALAFFFFGALGTHSWALIYLSGLLLTGVFYTMQNAVYPAFFPELFPVGVRYTGMAISLQFGLVLAGFTPAISESLTAAHPTQWLPVAIFTAICCLAAGIASLTARETANTATSELGLTREPSRRERMAAQAGTAEWR